MSEANQPAPSGLGLHEAASQIEALLADPAEAPATPEAPKAKRKAAPDPVEETDEDIADDADPDDQDEDAVEDAADPDAETDDDASSEEEGEEAQDEDDSEEGDDTPADETFTLKVQGQDHTVTRDEMFELARKGFDYTQKTQALAEERKTVQTMGQQTAQERDLYARGLKAIAEQLDALQPKEPIRPDFVRIEQQYGREAAMAARMQYDDQRALWQGYDSKITWARSQVSEAEERQRQFEEQARLEYAAEQRKLLPQINPAWSDEKAFVKDSSMIREYLGSVGAPPDIESAITDNWMIKILYDAARGSQSEKQAAKPLPKPKPKAKPASTGPATARPGGANIVPRRHTDFSKAKMRLAKSGDVKDAAAAFMNMPGLIP
ncbi:conserved hypothetical protein [Hyphomicrobiales bacterium]|nr:conserved hypothetical protein [Hyphomicrobiales bacterium]CAH1668557.1 conserved hypothetical protein [Hyphomicrobiales bacterium]